MNKEQKTEKIQYYLTGLFKLFVRIFWIFPIRNNHIFCIASGGEFWGNPYYVYRFLLDRYGNDFDFTWAVKDVKRSDRDNVRFVRLFSFSFFLRFCTAKIIVCNEGMPTYMPKRKGQFLINTWHGGGAYKRLVVHSKYGKKISTYKGKCADVFVSSCDMWDKLVFPILCPQKNREIMKCGTPRNDIFFFPKTVKIVRQNVCKELSITEDSIIVLYAPTYRGWSDTILNSGSSNRERSWSLDVSALQRSIQKRFGKGSCILFRKHHSDKSNMMNGVVNVSEYPDVQELLCAADILISDYSSIIWDFSLMKKPCFLFCPDLDYYLNDDRGVYTPIESWPGIICRTNEELEQAILNLNEEEYAKKVEQHHADLGSYETGTACKQVCDRIYEVCFGEKPKEEYNAKL